MNIKIYGFTWNIEPSKNNIEDFLRYIQSLNQVELQSLESGMPTGVNYRRIALVTNLDDNLWGGIFLTIKNTRKFIRSSKSEKGFKISTAEIENNENFADANFFIFNPKTGAGLYEYYHLSAYLNTFNSDIGYKFKLYKSVKDLQAKFVYSQFLTPSDFESHVKALSAVHNIEYELSTIGIPSAGIVPASGLVSRQRIKVFYERKFQASDELRNSIGSFIKQNYNDIKRMFVKGKTINGDDVSYSLIDDTSTLDEREFKTFNINLDIDENVDDSLKSSSNLKQLVRISKKLNVSDFFNTEREP